MTTHPTQHEHPEHSDSLAPFYAGWDVYQNELVKMLAPLTAQQLTLRASSHHWSVGQLATHIAATRAGWFHGWMGEGDPALAEFDRWDETVEPSRPADELVAALVATSQMIEASLAHTTPADLSQKFLAPDPRKRAAGHNHTRQWIVYHVLEHDIFHGGEISLILGMHGVAGLDL